MSREIDANRGKLWEKRKHWWRVVEPSTLLFYPFFSSDFFFKLHDSEINLARKLSSRWLKPPSAGWYMALYRSLFCSGGCAMYSAFGVFGEMINFDKYFSNGLKPPTREDDGQTSLGIFEIWISK